MLGFKVYYKIHNDYLTITYVRNHNLHLQVGYTTKLYQEVLLSNNMYSNNYPC